MFTDHRWMLAFSMALIEKMFRSGSFGDLHFKLKQPFWHRLMWKRITIIWHDRFNFSIFSDAVGKKFGAVIVQQQSQVGLAFCHYHGFGTRHRNPFANTNLLILKATIKSHLFSLEYVRFVLKSNASVQPRNCKHFINLCSCLWNP